MSDHPVLLLGKKIESLCWNDLETLKPLEPVIFGDIDSIDLIVEWCEENKRKIKAFCSRNTFGSYVFYFTPRKVAKRWYHQPRMLSAEFSIFDDDESWLKTKWSEDFIKSFKETAGKNVKFDKDDD